jgi:hypothetical protein
MKDNLMNSPQPLSASQRGAKNSTPFFYLQKQGAGGMSSCLAEENIDQYYNKKILKLN